MKHNLISHSDHLIGRPADSCVFVIFGAIGDLTKRLLIPAICHLGSAKLLSSNFHIVGVARHPIDNDQYRRHFLESIDQYVQDEDAKIFGKEILSRVSYCQGDVSEKKCFQTLRDHLHALSKTGASDNYLYYLATPPQMFAGIINHLGDASLTMESDNTWRRVIIEKPFGQDLLSSKKLNDDIAKVLSESQIFRIDHYLGKETVQNILAFRFANRIFEPIWNRHHIDHVQITVAESLGVEKRGNFYDAAGALRDMVPNHLFQLLSYVGMEPPISPKADDVRDQKVRFLEAIRAIPRNDVDFHCVRGQYGEGTKVGNLPSYRNEEKVNPLSATETYVALKLMIDNERWRDVPFYLRTGKRLAKRATEIVIQFKDSPSLFPEKACGGNLIVFQIQPEQGIFLRLGSKIPGPVMQLTDVNMKFDYNDYFEKRASTGYETLLYDAMNGDSTLFQRADMVEAGWRIVDPILNYFASTPPGNFPNYASGSEGPKEADDLLERDGRQWRALGN